MEGEAIPPDSVKSFFKMLYTRNVSTTEELSSTKSRLTDSSAADAVFCCSAGKLPGKQLSLGFTLKSMISSKKVLTLMHHYGHCGSSETVRRVDMSLESTLNNSDSFIPDGIETRPNQLTGTAWDNYLETLSGGDTIHRIYGICYQTIKEKDEIETEESSGIHLK